MLVTKREPRNDLYNGLIAESDELRGRRDRGSVSRRRLRRPSVDRRRIFDGHRLAREIDSPDPAEPLPYLRESRRLVPELA